MKQILLALALAGFANLEAIACIDMESRDVPLTPQRTAYHQKERDKARAELEKARQEKDDYQVRSWQRQLAATEKILASGRETIYVERSRSPAVAKPPSADSKKTEVAKAMSSSCRG
jgi:hypothetical protein